MEPLNEDKSCYLSLTQREVLLRLLTNPAIEQTLFFDRGDTIHNIVSNKLCTVVSRTEPKDFVDFFMILKKFPSFKIEDIYKTAQFKDAIFDDPPTAAFQLEGGLIFLKENRHYSSYAKRV